MFDAAAMTSELLQNQEEATTKPCCNHSMCDAAAMTSYFAAKARGGELQAMLLNQLMRSRAKQSQAVISKACGSFGFCPVMPDTIRTAFCTTNLSF